MKKRERVFPVPGLFVLPVRRKLMLSALLFLVGIQLTSLFAVPFFFTIPAFLLSAVCLWVERKRRKSGIVFLSLLFLTAGILWGGVCIRPLDGNVAGKHTVSGTVDEIRKDNSVYLKNVSLEDGTVLHRRVLITLLSEEDSVPAVYPGQILSGEGKLYSPERRRNAGGTDSLIYALSNGYEMSGYLTAGWKAEGRETFSFRELVRRIREKLDRVICGLFGTEAPVFEAILIGRKNGIDDEVYTAMQLTGIAHLLSVSGLHLGLLAFLLEKLTKRFSARRKQVFAGKVLVLGAFTLITGAAFGTIRAFVMAVIRAYSVLRNRDYDPLTSLSAAAFLILVPCPSAALSASFLLSFSAVLGILILQPVAAEKARKLFPSESPLRSFADLCVLSMSAQIGILPMQLLLYGYVPLLSLPMNILCGSFLPVLMAGGWLCVLLSFLPVIPAAASVFSLFAAGMETFCVQAAALPMSILRLPAPYAPAIWLFESSAALIAGKFHFGRKKRLLAVLAAGVFLLSYLPRFNPEARYVQLDVGQGDAAVIRNGRDALLIDVGLSDSNAALRYLRSEGLNLRGVILSHLDEDHAGGLEALLESEIPVNALMYPKGAEWEKDEDQAIHSVLERVSERNIPVSEVEAGAAFSAAGADFRVLSPTPDMEGSNERSLLLYAELNGKMLLLTGDLPSSSERTGMPDCDILKVAHHGSASSTSDEFLSETRPEWALISVGTGNMWGHPTGRVLESLKKAGSRILRTDESGCITLWLGGAETEADMWIHDGNGFLPSVPQEILRFPFSVCRSLKSHFSNKAETN